MAGEALACFAEGGLMRYRNLIIDGSWLAYSRFCVGSLPGGFLCELARLRNGYSPGVIFVAWDHPSGSGNRKNIHPEYKSGRRKKDGYFETLKDLQHGLSLIWVNQVQSEHGEADDVIATIARTYPGPTLIHTADKDLLQLVSDSVHVLRPTGEIITPYNISDRTGLTAREWKSYLTLAGDPCDRIPGAKGIGEKLAKTMLSACPMIIEFLKKEEFDKIREEITENNISLLKYAERVIADVEGILVTESLVSLYDVELEFIDGSLDPQMARDWLNSRNCLH